MKPIRPRRRSAITFAGALTLSGAFAGDLSNVVGEPGPEIDLREISRDDRSGLVTLRWSSQEGHLYLIEESPDPEQVWETNGDPVTGQKEETTWTVEPLPGNALAKALLYRVRPAAAGEVEAHTNGPRLEGRQGRGETGRSERAKHGKRTRGAWWQRPHRGPLRERCNQQGTRRVPASATKRPSPRGPLLIAPQGFSGSAEHEHQDRRASATVGRDRIGRAPCRAGTTQRADGSRPLPPRRNQDPGPPG